MSKTYRLLVADDAQTYAATDGDINLISYAARNLDLGADSAYDVKLTQTDRLAGDTTGTVLALTADGGTIKFLLGRALRKERKAADASADAEVTEQETPAETEQEQPEPAFV